MNKITIIVWMLLASVSSFSQIVSGVYSSREATWFGIDFTYAKMIGDFGSEISPEVIRDKYYNAWNALLLTEKDKYDLPQFLHKQHIVYSLETVTALNSAIEPDSIFLPEFSTIPLLSLGQLQEMTSAYAQEARKGIGVLIAVECFNKSESIAILDIVFFDISTGRLYFAKRFSEKPHGAGLRNFWAKTFLLMLEDASSNWDSWSKEEKRKGK